MSDLISNVQEHAAILVVLAIVLLPILYAFRRYTGPFFMYVGELIAYSLVFHTIVHGIVRLFAWFRKESAFRDGFGNPIDEISPLRTPFLNNFWDRALYAPTWLFYFELVCVAAIFYVVIFLRPTRFGRSHRQRTKRRETRKKTFSKYQNARAAQLAREAARR